MPCHLAHCLDRNPCLLYTFITVLAAAQLDNPGKGASGGKTMAPPTVEEAEKVNILVITSIIRKV